MLNHSLPSPKRKKKSERRVCLGAFNSGQRPVGTPKENGTKFSDQTGPAKVRGMALPIFYSFSEFTI